VYILDSIFKAQVKATFLGFILMKEKITIVIDYIPVSIFKIRSDV